MTRNFADTYFSKKDCAKIGYICEDIERNYKKGNLNNRERAILITSLLYAMDKIAVTCGRYDTYRQGVNFERLFELAVTTHKQKKSILQQKTQRSNEK